MSISLSDLTKRIKPNNTVLFFGAGSSIPSGAPSVTRLIELFSDLFSLDSDGYSLSEISSLVEQKRSRKEMIECLRIPFKTLTATGSLLNVPLYNWKNIYTTNYDNLIEQAYSKKQIPLSVTSTNRSE